MTAFAFDPANGLCAWWRDSFFRDSFMGNPSIFRTKSIFKIQHEIAEGSSAMAVSLKRHLGATSLILFGIGVLLGAGLLSLTGLAAGL